MSGPRGERVSGVLLGLDPTLHQEQLVVKLVDLLPAVPGAFAWLHREWCSGATVDHCTCRVHLIAYQSLLLQ